VNPHFSHINSPFMEELRRHGLKVYPWTVNNPSDIRLMKQLGVDGIITDYLDRF